MRTPCQHVILTRRAVGNKAAQLANCPPKFAVDDNQPISQALLGFCEANNRPSPGGLLSPSIGRKLIGVLGRCGSGASLEEKIKGDCHGYDARHASFETEGTL